MRSLRRHPVRTGVGEEGEEREEEEGEGGPLYGLEAGWSQQQQQWEEVEEEALGGEAGSEGGEGVQEEEVARERRRWHGGGGGSSGAHQRSALRAAWLAALLLPVYQCADEERFGRWGRGGKVRWRHEVTEGTIQGSPCIGTCSVCYVLYAMRLSISLAPFTLHLLPLIYLAPCCPPLSLLPPVSLCIVLPPSLFLPPSSPLSGCVRQLDSMRSARSLS